jgi:uncharacterized protein YecE (DUF72 family)
MNVHQLYPAVALVRESRYSASSKQAGFLRAYPALLIAARLEAKNPMEAFLRTASLAYGWMPRRLRLDEEALPQAVDAFEAARREEVVISEELISPIASCLSSLVGASKVLHLANPSVFPIWGKRIERFRLQRDPTPYHMGQSRNYLSFIEDIWKLTSDPLFLTFHNEYCTAYQERLQRLQISPYPLTEPRVVQSATSELA